MFLTVMFLRSIRLTKTISYFVLFALLAVPMMNADEIRLDNVGTSTGDLLDEVKAANVPVTISVAEIVGLDLTVTAIAGSGSSTDLNVTASSLGVNAGDAGDNTERFDALFGESTTWEFDKAVKISQLDFTAFESGDVFVFGGTTINNVDLSSGTTDIYDFSTPLSIAANTGFTLQATTGSVGIEGITLTVVPEPTSFALFALSCIGLLLPRRYGNRRG